MKMEVDIKEMHEPAKAEQELSTRGFPGGAVVKNPPANARDMGSSSGLEDRTCQAATKPVRHNY